MSFYGCNEAVAKAGKRLYVARRVSGVLERLANFVDGHVETMVEIDEGIVRPEFLSKLLSGDHFPSPFQQGGKQLKRLFLELRLEPVLPKLPCARVHLEDPEPNVP